MNLIKKEAKLFEIRGGAVVSWLLRSSPDRAVRVRALAEDIVLCSWARHLTLTVPLSTQEYKWVPAKCWGNLTNCGGVTCDRLASRPGGVAILLAASCYRNRDKLRQLYASRLQGFFFFKIRKSRDVATLNRCARRGRTFADLSRSLWSRWSPANTVRWIHP